MSTMNQIFTEFRENIDKCQHTTTGLIDCMRYYLDKLSKASGGGSGSTVSVDQIQTTGNKIASVTVDGDKTDLYSPKATVSQTVTAGTKIASVDNTDIYVPYKTTSAVSGAISATTVTISDASIATTSVIDIYSQNSSGSLVNVKTCVVTTGQAVLTFDALEEATSFILHVYN